MNYHIVAKANIIAYFKNSKLFQLDLGQSFDEVKDNGERKSNLSGFIKIYHAKKNHFLFKEGKVGIITFYNNPYMVDNVISVFDDSFNELNLVYDFKYDFSFGFGCGILKFSILNLHLIKLRNIIKSNQPKLCVFS